MPHIRLEYSDNVTAPDSFQNLFADIHQVLHEQGGIALDNCKSRARQASHCYVGDGNPANAFIDLRVEIVSGRSDELKGMLSAACLDVLKRHYVEQLRDGLQITAGVYDIPRESYSKHPQGTLNY